MVELNQIINADCMEILKDIPDNYFELAIVDPPYGGGVKQMPLTEATGDLVVGGKSTDKTTEVYPDENVFKGSNGRFGNKDNRFEKYNKMKNENEIKATRTGGTWAEKYSKPESESSKISNWDIAPPQEYFEELFRVSKNQIIWGGNYFALPPTRCFLIWKKLTISENFSMAMCEYAWTSFNDNAKIFEYAPQDKERFHPTQKPVALYEWVISKYAKEGDKILDTHSGSGSCCVASYNQGHEFLGIELDEFYCKKSQERLEQIMSQERWF